MEKPRRFYMYNLLTGEEKPFISYYTYPTTEDVTEWVEIEPGMKQKQVVWQVIEDMRYKARLRLYNYLTYTKQGEEIPQYRPYKGSTEPILNF